MRTLCRMGLKTGFYKGRNDAARDRENKQTETKFGQLALCHSLPPDPRITDPRDAPEGTNLDQIAIIGTKAFVGKVADLRPNNGDDGEMEDVPLGEDEEPEWEKVE